MNNDELFNVLFLLSICRIQKLLGDDKSLAETSCNLSLPLFLLIGRKEDTNS